ncbi:MAG: hypothetical protein HY377_01980 [Candidatus Blackburnbacteria bacterium]|nr:hypothetical protein [Candidatus Blackburnbacteria bacterium]
MKQYFRTAWKHIRRAPYQALAAIVIMTLTFFVATILAVLANGSSQTIAYFETKPQIIAFLKEDATPEQVSNLQHKLEGDQRVKNVHYVSKEQALKFFREASDNPSVLELVSPNIFPTSLEFSVTNLSFANTLVKEVQGEKIVDQVLFTASLSADNLEEVIARLHTIANYIRVGGGIIFGFLLASSFLILLVIISMRISTRRGEIEILSLIGATKGFIRSPFVIEGILYAVFGAFLGWLSASLLILYGAPSLSQFFRDVPMLPTQTSALLTLLGIILGGELILAIFIGVFGSFLALRRYLKI